MAHLSQCHSALLQHMVCKLSIMLLECQCEKLAFSCYVQAPIWLWTLNSSGSLGQLAIYRERLTFSSAGDCISHLTGLAQHCGSINAVKGVNTCMNVQGSNTQFILSGIFNVFESVLKIDCQPVETLLCSDQSNRLDLQQGTPYL